jgi:PAS domain S-box-containing protein
MLESLLNATENAVLTTDPHGQVASLNRVAEVMFGYEAGEFIGRPITALISDEAAENGGEASSGPRGGSGRRKDGSQFPVEVSRASWTDAQGREASGAIVRDVTERRRAEEAAHTRDKLAALGRIAGGLAHELNNLLQPIIGLTQLELEQLPGDGTEEQMETRESLTMVLDSGKQARDVVKKLLIFARKARPPLAPVDVSAALCRMELFDKDPPPGIHVDRIISENAVGAAVINEAELLEVMRILVNNAAYAMDGRGTVTIRVDRVELTGASASPGMAAGPAFRISVADTGCGIDADIRAQIFEPFFTSKPVGQGMGLGLSVAYSVLNDWKGVIAVDSTVGSGSTFTLYLPIDQTA